MGEWKEKRCRHAVFCPQEWNVELRICLEVKVTR